MRFLGAILILSLSSSPSANDNIPDELFNSIQSLTQIEQVLKQANEQCIENSPIPSAKEALESNSSYFSGITPKSAKWNELVMIHQEYKVRSCNYFNPSEFARSHTKALLSGYTLAEVKELEEYFLSDLGKKLTKQSLKANAHLQASLSRQLASYSIELNKWYIRSIQELAMRPEQPTGG